VWVEGLFNFNVTNSHMNKKTINLYRASAKKDIEVRPYCKSTQIIKHGHQHNSNHPRRFRCKDCGKIFNEKIDTVYYHKKVSEDVINTMAYFFLTGYPISNMPPLFNLTEKTIRNILKEVIMHFKKYEKFVFPKIQIARQGSLRSTRYTLKSRGKRDSSAGWLMTQSVSI